MEEIAISVVTRVSVSILTFVVMREVLAQSSIYSNSTSTRTIVAVCLAIISACHSQKWIDLLILCYSAMTLVVGVVFVILLVRRLFEKSLQKEDEESEDRETFG